MCLGWSHNEQSLPLHSSHSPGMPHQLWKSFAPACTQTPTACLFPSLLWEVTYCFSMAPDQTNELLCYAVTEPHLLQWSLNPFYIWTSLGILYPRVPYRVSLFTIVILLPQLIILYIKLYPVYCIVSISWLKLYYTGFSELPDLWVCILHYF